MATILCIDDDPKTLEVQRAILERNGYTVLLAEGGSAGIRCDQGHVFFVEKDERERAA